MNLLIFLSDRCNMACGYCFLELNKGPAVVLDLAAAKRAISDNPGARVTVLGGEPFIHYPLLKGIVSFIGGKTPVTVVTNGTLACPEKMKELQDLGAQIVVSLDGKAASHDAHRPLVGGGGSSLEESLKALESCDKVGLRINMVVCEDTAAFLLSNIEYIRQQGFSRVSFHLNILEPWSDAGLETLRRSLKGFERYHEAVRGSLEITHLGSFLTASVGHEDEELVLGADGRYYPCDGLFTLPYAAIGGWSVGDAASGVDWKKRAGLLKEARKDIHGILGGKAHYSCPQETYFHSLAAGRDPEKAVRSFGRADKILGDALSRVAAEEAAFRGEFLSGPDFKLRPRDPRQDLQYGESLLLCEDPKPYIQARRRLRSAPELVRGVAAAYLADFKTGIRHLTRAIERRPDSSWAYAWRGVARAMECRRLKTQDGLKEALADLDKAIDLGPAAAFCYPWRAELRHDLDDKPGALADLEKIPVENAWARVEKGEILCESGRPAEAMKVFDALVKEYPKAAWTVALRGRTLATSGREEKSLKDLKKAIALDPRSAAYHAWLAESLRKLGRYREALSHLDTAIGMDPRFTLAWVWRGRIKLLLGRLKDALRDLDRAVRLDPRYQLAFAWRGETLFKLGRKAAAARDLRRVAPMDLSRTWNAVVKEGEPLTPAARSRAYAARERHRAKVSVMAAMARGRRRVDRRDFAGAIACFDEAVRLDPRCVQAYLYRAGLKLLADDEPGALDDFRRISTLDHSCLPAYRDLTTVSAEEFPALIPAAERILRRDPRCAWAHVFHAFSLRSLMKYEQAIEDMDRAVASEPRSAALWAMRSRVKLTNRQGLYDGVADMREAVALEPEWGWLHCWLGEALRHQGDFPAALKALDRGIELDDRYLRGYAWRGGVKVALGRYREAIRDLDRSLAFDPIYHYDFEYTADQKSWAFNQRMLADRGLGDVRQALRDLNQAHRFGPRYCWVFNPGRKAAVFEKAIRELGRAKPDPWAYAWRGWTYQQWGKNEEALADMERALERSPRLAWPWAWKGKILLNLGQADRALPALDKAVALDPSYAPAWGWRGEARRLSGRRKAAASDFTRAIRLDHRAAWAFAGRGECLGRLADLDRALAICPDYAEAYGWRAEVRRASGDFRGALSDADEALRLKPGLVLVYLTRSLAKGALKDFKGQIADFRKAERLGVRV